LKRVISTNRRRVFAALTCAVLLSLAGSSTAGAAGGLTVTVPSGSPVAGGGSAPIDVQVTNTTNGALNPTVTIVLPSAHVAYNNDAAGATCNYSSPTLTCTLSLPDQTPADITFSITPDPSATGSISASAADSDAGVSSDPATLAIATEADLVPSISGPALSSPQVAGDLAGFDYTVSVHNGGPSDNTGGYTVSGTLPSGLVFVSSALCSGSGTSFTCPKPSTPTSGLAFNATDSYTVHVKVLPSACPAGASATPPCNGNVPSSVSVTSTGTDDPSTPASSNTASTMTAITTEADLEAVSMGASNNHLFANSAPANTETFTYELMNRGPSDAQHVSVSLPDHPGGAGNPPYFIIDNVCRKQTAGDCSSPPTDFSSNTDIGEVDAGATVDVVIIAHANPALGIHPPLPIISGFFTFANTATVSSPTDDPGSYPNVRSNLSPTVRIDTVASPPQNPFAIPGSTNAILTWQNSASNGGQTIQDYVIMETPPGGTAFQLTSVPFNALPTSACAAVAATNCYQVTVTGLQNDSPNGPYTFSIQAENAVGQSDPATTQVSPSVNATNATVPTNTAKTLTTCTTATVATPVCVVYTIPGGSGGVFGAQGVVPVANNFCGGDPCSNPPCVVTTTHPCPPPENGALELGSLLGYNVPTKPLQETITWDSSTIDPKYYAKPVKACANGATITTCYPNDIPIYYEDTFTLLHCGVGFPGVCDSSTLVDHSLFPVVPGTLLNGLHFCALPTPNGAGNKNYARINPGTGIYNGYNDPSGSACIKSINALGSANSPGANRDIQVVINLTSDSDGLSSKH
jgi:uncharacterized repeat protein (TIGR01451 family)